MRSIMNKWVSRWLIVSILATTAFGMPIGSSGLTVQAATPDPATNLNFENGNLSGWNTTGTVVSQTEDKVEGTYSAKLSAVNSTLSQTIAGIPQGSYTLYAWIKGTTSSSNNAAYLTATNTGGPDTRLLIDGYVNGAAWTQVALRNVLIYNGQATITFGSGSGSNLSVDDVQLVLDSSDDNPVSNWGFETGDLTGWTVDQGTVTAVSGSDTGSTAAALAANAQISQTVNVKPNATYIATVRAKVDRQDTWETIYQKNYLGNTGQLVNVTSYGDRVNLGVKDANGTVLRQAPDGTAGYALLTIRFKTGPNDHQVTVYANTIKDEHYDKSVATFTSSGANGSRDQWQGNGSDLAYVDNFDIFEIDNSTIKGADVSFLPIIEDKGGKYFANGVQQDCLTILANHGVNAITGMLFVHAGNPIYDQSSPKKPLTIDFADEAGNPILQTMQAGYFDKTHALMLAERAKDLDIGYLPSFHFSDTWMSAGKAYTPLDWMYKDGSGNWVDQTQDEMTTTMYNYVFDFIKSLVDRDMTPLGVKIGNEQDGGIAWPRGKSYSSAGFKALINAAYDAVHDAAPGVSAFIHSNNGYTTSYSNTVFGTLNSNGTRFDGQAYSLYSGHTSDAILSMITNNNELFPDKDYLDVETGYTFTKYNPDWADESGSMGQAAYYVSNSPNGQYNWLLDYMQAMRDVPNPHERMRGFFYWETDWIVVEGAGWATGGPNTVDRRTMFNNGDVTIKEMGSTANGKMGDMMDSMYAYLWRGHAKDKPAAAQTPLKGFGTYSVTKANPTGIALDQTAVSLVQGKTTRLLPTITPDSNGSSNKLVYDSNVIWTSSNPAIATVNTYGYVTAVAPGTARITATTAVGGLSASADFTVNSPTNAGSLTLTVNGSAPAATLNAKVWDQQTLVATLPAGASNKRVTFTSSDPSVASFLGEFWQSSNPGKLVQQTDKTINVKLNAKRDGTTIITARSEDGTATASYTLNVAKIPVTSITLNAASATVSLGRTKQLTAAVAPSNASFNTVTWTSSDPTVATVDATGLVKTLRTGTTTITAASDDDASVKATSAITVVPVQVSGVSLDKPTLNIMIGSSKPLTAIIAPDDAFDKSVQWSTSDSSIATVDGTGKVTGVKVGTATVTVKTADGNFTAATTVNVQSSPVAVTGVTMNKSTHYFASDYFSSTNPSAAAPVEKLIAGVTPADATNTDVEWSSNNPTVASVDAYGNVTALKAGMAAITAKTKDGGFAATTNVYVPIVSESFDNRTIGDNWSATVGSTGSVAYFGSTGVATVSGNQVFSLGASGSGARSEYKSFSVTNNKIVLDFDWNVGAPAAGTGQLRIQDSSHNNYITFGIPTGATSAIVYDTSASIASNTVIAGTPVSASGFKTAGATYRVKVTLDMTAKTTSFTMTNKADSTMTTTVNNLPFASGATFANNLGYLEFYATRSGSMSWTTWVDNFNVYAAAPVAASVTLNKSSLSLLDIPGTPGNTAQLTATVNPNVSGVDQSVVWTSSDTSVATVTNGFVTAVADGDAVITAKSVANAALTATAAVNVHTLIPVEAIGINDETGAAVDETTVNMSLGADKQLTPVMNPGVADYRSLSWSSSDHSVAVVDAAGLVKAVGPGEATITLTVDAYADYGGYQGTKSLTVNVTGSAVSVTGISLDTATLSLATGASGQLTATIAPADATNKVVSWTSSNAAVAQVDLSGLVTAVAAGTAVITATTADGGFHDSVTVTVTAAPVSVTGVSLNPTTLSLTQGTSGQLTATVAPANATNKNVTWSSSNTAIATVDPTGKVTAVSPGMAAITVATADGNKTAAAAVTVTSALNAISVAPVAGLQNGARSDFIMGADVSELNELEKYGKTFYDTDGSELSALQILKNHGVNYIRLRLWNDPTDAFGDPIGGGNTDLASVIATAKNAKSLGLKVLLDFHYSDFWADPGKQTKPKAWTNITGTALQLEVYKFTYESLAAMQAAGVLPEMVQIGNEINGGLLWTEGNSATKAAPFLQQASLAVRTIDPSIQIMIHMAGSSSGSASSFTSNFNAWTSGSTAVDFDIIGISAYPYWHGTMAQNANIVKTLASTYNKPVIVAETAYGWTLEPGDETINNFDQATATTAGYTPTPQGQATELRDIINNLANVPNDMGLGMFYWGAVWLPGTDTGWITGQGSGWENQALFDYNGKALPSIDVFNLVRSSTVTPASNLLSAEPYYATVNAGGSLSLPSTVSGRYSDGYYKSVIVSSWDTSAVNMTTPGIYTALGTVNGVAGAAKAVVTVLSAQPSNLVVNPGLETATGWTINSPLARKSNATDAHSGTYALHFSSTTTAKTAYQTISGLANGTYTYTVWAEAYGTNSNTDVFLYATGHDSSNPSATLKQSVTIGSWGAWNQYQITVPVTSATVTIGVSVKGDAGLYGDFDDFYFGLPPASADPSTVAQPAVVKSAGGATLADGDLISEASPYVTLTTATPGATIFYSTDGSTPSYSNGSSTTLVYTGPIRIRSNTVLKFYTTAPGYANSAVSTYAFKFDSSDASSYATGGGFEQNGDLGGWTLAGATHGTDNATYVFDSVADPSNGVVFAGNGQFKYWSSTGYGFTLSRTLTGLPNGVYKLMAQSAGASNYKTDAVGRATNNAGVATLTLKATTQTMQASANVINQGTSSATGWNIWKPFGVTDLIVTDGSLTITFEASAAANYWGYLDDIKLVRTGDYSQGAIAGTVMDNLGHAVDGATVELALNGQSFGQTVSGVDGSYAFAAVLAGNGYTVTASKSGLTAGSVNNVQVSAGQVTANIDPVLTGATAVSDIALNTQSAPAAMIIGETYRLIATVTPAEAANKTVYFSTNDSNIATLSNEAFDPDTGTTGVTVTATGIGDAVITATMDDGGKTATYGFTVVEEVVAASGVDLDLPALTLEVGETGRLTATVAPANATNKTVAWSSSDESVATVDAAGNVTAVGAGTALITATTNDGGFTATAEITVTPATGGPVFVNGISLDQTSLSLAAGSVERLTATVAPTNATNKTVAWSSNDESVATVDAAGNVTAVGEGTAVITATTNDGGFTATAVIIVTPATGGPVSVSGISLNYPSLSLTAGSIGRLTATVAPANATNKGVVWSSDNPSVATVDASGNVIAVGVGLAIITATTDDGGLTATAIVYVTPFAVITPPTEPVKEVRIENGKIIVLSPSTGDHFDLKSAYLQEAIDRSIDREVRIVMQPAQNSATVSVRLPADAYRMASERDIRTITFEVGLATVSFSTSLLDKGTAPGPVALTVSKVETNDLPAASRQLLGGNPAYDFNLSVNGEPIHRFGAEDRMEVEIGYTLKPGENPNQVVVYFLNATGQLEIVKISKYDPATGKAKFKPKHFSKYAAAYSNVSFADLDKVGWAKEGIEALAARGAVSGVGAGKFDPSRPVSRAEFIAMLMNAFDLIDDTATSTLSDVKAGSWYYAAVASAQKLGIVNGKSNGTFGVNETISRQDMAVMAYKAALAMKLRLNAGGTAAEFADQSAIAGYAKESVAAMQLAGLMNGSGNGKFEPNAQSSRAQAAVLIYRLFQLI